MKKAFLLILLVCGFARAQKPVFTVAKPTAATVYFNSAEITERATITLPAGTSEVVVKNVADYLYENTVQIGAPSTVTVLSVQFTNNYISEFEVDENTPALKKVRDSIAVVKKEIEKISTLRIAEQSTVQLLDQSIARYGQQTNLSVAELTKMVDYYKGKRNEAALAVNAFNEKEHKLNERLTDLNSKLEVTNKQTEKTSSGKLVLQVMNDAAGPVQFDITYLTTGASWTPFYDLRAENTSQPINMLYKAQVVQSTGIDWKKVKLTLNSGTPNQNSQAPLLQAWLLRFGQAMMMGYGNSNLAMNSISIRGLSSSGIQADAYGKKEMLEGVNDYTTITENQLSISFDID
ncbi:MAG: mucoidy inhibitor MuiA family protein, partial [Bacteroidota bacterium]